MSIIYNVRSYSSTPVKYCDPDGEANCCVLNTIDHLHRNREFTYRGGEASFNRRQAVYEELLEKKHGASLLTLLEESTSTFAGARKDTEIYRMVFNDGFVILKEVTVEYHSDHTDRNITYYITKEGWDMLDPLNNADYVGFISMYGKRV